MRSVAIVGCLFVIVACISESRRERERPAGGPCTYQPFEGSCRLETLVEQPEGADVRLIAGYVIPGRARSPASAEAETAVANELGGDLRYELVVAAARAGAARQHLVGHRMVPCRGEQITSGTCTPISGTVDVPPLANP